MPSNMRNTIEAEMILPENFSHKEALRLLAEKFGLSNLLEAMHIECDLIEEVIFENVINGYAFVIHFLAAEDETQAQMPQDGLLPEVHIVKRADMPLSYGNIRVVPAA